MGSAYSGFDFCMGEERSFFFVAVPYLSLFPCIIGIRDCFLLFSQIEEAILLLISYLPMLLKLPLKGYQVVVYNIQMCCKCG
jgi:hypothetical protein